jgi:hypothetical protein
MMEAERFGSLKGEVGPFVSVYFDDSHDTADAEEHLHAIWRDVRKHLEDRGADEAVMANLERAILTSRPPVGRRGRGVIATRDRVLMNERLLNPPSLTTLRMSDYPYVLPMVQFGMEHPPYVVAAVDHAGADIVLHQGGIVHSTTFEGTGYPIHKVARAGFNGYSDPAPRADEAVRKNVRAIVDHLTELVDATGVEVLFINGAVRARSDVMSALPDRIASRVAPGHLGARHSRPEVEDIDDLVETEFRRRRGITDDAAAERFLAESARGSGLAVTGLAQVSAALREGDVDTLLVGDLGDLTVLAGKSRGAIAPDADALSELGQAARWVVRADEALPYAAITTGASLTVVDSDVALVEGVGALMRYPMKWEFENPAVAGGASN